MVCLRMFISVNSRLSLNWCIFKLLQWRYWGRWWSSWRERHSNWKEVSQGLVWYFLCGNFSCYAVLLLPLSVYPMLFNQYLSPCMLLPSQKRNFLLLRNSLIADEPSDALWHLPYYISSIIVGLTI